MSITILYFINVIFLTLISTFFIGTKGTHIKKIINDMPISLIEDAIIKVNEQEIIDPHFDMKAIKKNINNYLIISLIGECEKYYISFCPYQEIIEDDKKEYFFDMSDNIKHFQLHFSCKYYGDLVLNSYLRYSIENQGVIKDEY
jgi:hypothetical protein